MPTAYAWRRGSAPPATTPVSKFLWMADTDPTTQWLSPNHSMRWLEPFDSMAKSGQGVGHILRDGRLEPEKPGVGLARLSGREAVGGEARRLDRFLRRHPEQIDVEEHLHHRLGDDPRAGRAEGHQIAAFGRIASVGMQPQLGRLPGATECG